MAASRPAKSPRDSVCISVRRLCGQALRRIPVGARRNAWGLSLLLSVPVVYQWPGERFATDPRKCVHMAVTSPQPKPGILDIEAYVPGESSVPGGRKPIKLSSNETPFGPSPKAVAAYRAAASDLERYPDGQATALQGRDRAPLRSRSCAHRVRGGVGRAVEPVGARLPRARATKGFSRPTAFSSIASRFWPMARRRSWRRRRICGPTSTLFSRA